MNGWPYYRTKDAALVPMMPGTPVYVDGMLSTLYYETRKAGLIDRVFCGDDLTHDQFIEFFQKRKTLQVLCKVEDTGTEKEKIVPCGFAWVDNPRGEDGARAAMCGFAFYGDWGKTKLARDLGWLGLAYWFLDLQIDVIHGILLESNIPARNYAQHLGFKQVAIVPKYHFDQHALVGARVMMIEKSDFVPEFEQWFDSQKLVAEPV